MDSEKENQNTIIRYGEYLILESIQNQKNILMDALAQKKPILFYADEIGHVDCAALQLLLSFTQAAAAQNMTWEWIEPSLPLLHIANVLGMNELLHLTEKP